MLYVITFLVIIMLIFINGFTDAPNAITTVVSTNVLPFKKAAFLSAIFNVIGIIVMCLINISVADCISTIVVLEDGTKGVIGLCSAMLSVVLFAGIASIYGIPTSETHALVAGLTGSAIAIGNVSNINIEEWINVIIGLIWSVLGTLIIVKGLFKLLRNKFYNINIEKIKRYQIYSSYGLSFMHGAQDGQKFIGIIILYMYIVKKMNLPQTINVAENVWVIIFVAVIMFFGVAVGGKKIVENIGTNTVRLDNVKAVFSDVSTILNLFIASLCGIPVSTTHVKTMSIIALGDDTTNKHNVLEIFKAWLYTFPVCLVLAYIFSKMFLEIFG